MNAPDAKILIIDIETTPIHGWTWQMWDANVLKVEDPSWILMTGYKWLGSDEPAKLITQPGVSPRNYKRNLKDDRLVIDPIKELSNLLAPQFFNRNSTSPSCPFLEHCEIRISGSTRGTPVMQKSRHSCVECRWHLLNSGTAGACSHARSSRPVVACYASC